MSDAGLPPSAAAPPTDEMAEWIVLETTDAKWGDLTERERNRFRRCVRLIVAASREGGSSPDETLIRAAMFATLRWHDNPDVIGMDRLDYVRQEALRAAAKVKLEVGLAQLAEQQSALEPIHARLSDALELLSASRERAAARPPTEARKDVTCECGRGPLEITEHEDEAGVKFWWLANLCTECLEETSLRAAAPQQEADNG